MAFVWSWIAFPGLIAGALSLALSAIIFKARPRRLQNRALAATLVFEAFNHLCGSSFMYLTDDPGKVFAWQVMTFVLASPSIGFYLLFLTTLDSPWVRPFQNRIARALLALSGFGVSAWVVLDTPKWVSGVFPFEPYAPYNAAFGPYSLPFATIFFLVMGAVGLAVSLNALFHAQRGTPARAQARMYSSAFAVRDLGYIAVFVPPFFGYAIHADLDLILFPPLVPLLYLPLLSYGILKTQLFDIDLKLKWTVRRGTVAVAFVALFLVVAKLTESWAERTFGQSWVLGAVAAGLLLFALTPLQRLADRLANAALPHVDESDQYRTFRKLQVYEAALQDLLQDGEVTPKERRMLDGLRARLEIAELDARRLEEDARRRATRG